MTKLANKLSTLLKQNNKTMDTKLDKTDVVILLDRSGSMAACKSAHEEGIKGLITEQKKDDGIVNFTLIQFDGFDPCEVVYSRVPINTVGDIVLEPRGSTPLLDAIGLCSNHVSSAIDNNEVDQVLVIIVTDGQENTSKEYSKSTIQTLIADKEKGNWTFLYLGANVDAFAEARGLGVAKGRAAGYKVNDNNIKAVYRSISSNTSSARQQLRDGMSMQDIAQSGTYSFTSDQMDAMND
jgi:Mg-chelatase subunit ChlD